MIRFFNSVVSISKKRLFLAYFLFLFLGLFFVSLEICFVGNILMINILENLITIEFSYLLPFYYSSFYFSLAIRFFKNLIYAYLFSFSKIFSILYSIVITLLHLFRLCCSHLLTNFEPFKSIITIILDPIFSAIIDFGFFPVVYFIFIQKKYKSQ